MTVSRAVQQVDETYEPGGGATSAGERDMTTGASVADAAVPADGSEQRMPRSAGSPVERDVDELYERFRELSATVERLEAENDRLRDELEPRHDAVAAEPVSAEQAAIGAETSWFERICRRFSSSN